MEPKNYNNNYKISWTQPYPQYNIHAEMIKLRDELIEATLDATDFEEADAVIKRIKSL
jgi:hypothetical protein